MIPVYAYDRQKIKRVKVGGLTYDGILIQKKSHKHYMKLTGSFPIQESAIQELAATYWNRVRLTVTDGPFQGQYESEKEDWFDPDIIVREFGGHGLQRHLPIYRMRKVFK